MNYSPLLVITKSPPEIDTETQQMGQGMHKEGLRGMAPRQTDRKE